MSYTELDGLSTNELLRIIVVELRVIRSHLEQITDEEISEEDIDYDIY